MKKKCIPREKLLEFKKSLKEMQKEGESSFSVLDRMDTETRRNFFEKFTEKDVAKEMNIGFENARLKGTTSAVLKWAEKNLKPEQVKEIKAKKPSDLEKLLQSDTLYEDLLNKQLGAELSTDEVKKFSELGKKAFDAYNKIPEGEIGNILNEGSFKATKEYFQKLKDLQEYTDSISPKASLWERTTNNTWKAGVLMTVKSTTLNILSNTMVLATERGIDRVINKNLGLKFGGKKLEYAKRAIDLYKNTNFDASRSLSAQPEDSVLGAGRYAGEKTLTPKTKIMQSASNFVFNKLLGLPDVAMGAIHRADNAGIMAESLVKKLGDNIQGFEGLKGEKLIYAIMEDGLRLNPKTEYGQIIKEISIHNARVGTFTNDSKLAKISTDLKRLLNKVGNVGEILMPFVKTPSNVIGLSLDYVGAGIPKVLHDTIKSLKDKNFILPKQKMQDNMKSIIRAGLGLTVASLIIDMIDDDYIGEYKPQETKKRNILGAIPDAIKINDKYVSLDYFGQLRTPIKLLLEFKTRNNLGTALVSTIASELENLPIFDGLGAKDVFDDISRAEGDVKKVMKNFPEKTLDRFYQGIPLSSQVGDIAKAMGSKKDVSVGKYSLGSLSFDRIVDKIPILREKLPEKTSVLGEPLESLGGMNILTGGRGSKAIETPATNEWKRLDKAGYAPSLKDISYTTSKNVKEIEEEIGREKLLAEMKEMGQKTSKDIEILLDQEKYQNADDETKQQIIEKVSTNRYNEFLNKYGKQEVKIKELEDIQENIILKQEKSKASQLAQDIVKNQKFISATREKKRAFLMDALNAGDLNEEDIKFIASQINK